MVQDHSIVVSRDLVCLPFRKCFACSLLLFLVVGGARTALAAILFVSPTGNDANNCISPATPCKTIQAAVNKSANGDQIRLAAGTYVEQVTVNNRQNLSIQGVAGAQLVPPVDATPHLPALIAIIFSERINIADLKLIGKEISEGISVQESSAVGILRCTIEDGNGGIVLFVRSTAHILGSTIRRCRRHGVRVDGTSKAAIGQVEGPPTIIEDNLFAGVIVNQGDVAFRGPVVILRNEIGVLGEGGTISSCCGEKLLSVTDNNAIGISLRGGSGAEQRDCRRSDHGGNFSHGEPPRSLPGGRQRQLGAWSSASGQFLDPTVSHHGD